MAGLYISNALRTSMKSFTRSQREHASNDYFTKINDKYKLKLNMKQGAYRTVALGLTEEPKPNIFYDPEILFLASQDDFTGDQLNLRSGQFSNLYKALEERFSGVDQKLVEGGIVVDKNGDIFVRGIGQNGDKQSPFNVKLANLREKYINLEYRLTTQFPRQAFGIMNIMA